jgi:hypothetical protein
MFCQTETKDVISFVFFSAGFTWYRIQKTWKAGLGTVQEHRFVHGIGYRRHGKQA